MWILIAQTWGILGHCGYYIPIKGLNPSCCFYKYFPTLRPEYHDAHHYLFHKNFGLMYTFTDRVFGTYQRSDTPNPLLIGKKE